MYKIKNNNRGGEKEVYGYMKALGKPTFSHIRTTHLSLQK